MIFKNLLYIYQLEHYDKKRFLSFAYRHINWFTLNKRSGLDWTMRVGLIFAGCMACITLVAMIIYFTEGFGWLLLFLALCVVLLPILIVTADTIIAPLVILKKNNTLLLAKKVIQNAKKKKLITVGITGSFGKTSVKNMLMHVLGEKYRVFAFPGNINTDIGVANYVLRHKDEILGADVLLSEMGAYKKGDIKKLCFLVEPDYSLTTAIGESHLERFGSFENIVSAKFELANATGRKVFLNVCDENIKKYAKTAIINTIEIVEVCGSERVEKVIYLKDFTGTSFVYRGETFTTKIIAGYAVDLAGMTFALADELGLTIVEMKKGFEKIDFIPHRLEVIRNEAVDRVVIDDSYNGNYNGFLAGLEVLERAKGRKVVVTPGIVELGAERSEEVHRELGKKYAENVDLLLLIKNKNTEYILKALRKIGYTNFKMYDTTQEAHDDLVNVLEDGDTILFQNDITDNYV